MIAGEGVEEDGNGDVGERGVERQEKTREMICGSFDTRDRWYECTECTVGDSTVVRLIEDRLDRETTKKERTDLHSEKL